MIIVAALLPIIYLRELSNIGLFSGVILIFSIISISIIIYLTSVILNETPQEVQDEYHISLTDDDRDYKYWDTINIPIFISTFMNVFEGNQ